tara:strand:+ start:219 stop:362 length:144 start_codon:yes stop_codon:yes gene_type:complete
MNDATLPLLGAEVFFLLKVEGGENLSSDKAVGGWGRSEAEPPDRISV